MKYYINDCNLVLDEIQSQKLGYPVGKLEKISVYFLHYKTYSDAKSKWDERKQRINWDNLYLTMMQHPDDEKLIERYLKLPYRKVLFVTNKDDSDEKEMWYLDGTVENGKLKDLCQYENKFTGRRLIDKFDYVSFLN